MDYTNEIPKHKKNTKSNISKSSKKSNHKHLYKKCIFHIKVDWFWKKEGYTKEYGEYCTVCGKVGNIISFLSSPERIQPWKDLEAKDELETFELSDWRQEFINK
jgi:hypothetical protein